MKKKLYIWIPIIIIAPSLFILLVSFILHIVVPTNINFAVLIFDFTKGMTIAEYLGIYAALMGAEVTVFLSCVIYELSENKERAELQEKKENARLILRNDADLYWSKIGEYITEKIRYICNISDVKLEKQIFEMNETWEKNLLLIRKDLPNYEYNFLFNFFTDVKSLLLNKDLYKFLGKYTIPFYVNGLMQKDMKNIDFNVVQSYKLFESLQSLIEGEKIERCSNYNNGHLFYIEKENGEKYIVHTVDGDIIYDYNFKTKTGYATRYVKGEIVSKGEFIAGKQVSGFSYNARCTEKGDYVKDWNGSSYIQVVEVYDPKKHILQADFEIIDGEYIRKSDIKILKFSLI